MLLLAMALLTGWIPTPRAGPSGDIHTPDLSPATAVVVWTQGDVAVDAVGDGRFVPVVGDEVAVGSRIEIGAVGGECSLLFGGVLLAKLSGEGAATVAAAGLIADGAAPVRQASLEVPVWRGERPYRAPSSSVVGVTAGSPLQITSPRGGVLRAARPPAVWRFAGKDERFRVELEERQAIGFRTLERWRGVEGRRFVPSRRLRPGVMHRFRVTQTRTGAVSEREFETLGVEAESHLDAALAAVEGLRFHGPWAREAGVMRSMVLEDHRLFEEAGHSWGALVLAWPGRPGVVEHAQRLRGVVSASR